MRYFSFDPDTGAFTGARTPQIDPLESQAAGAVVYCRPGAHDTTVAPPVYGAKQMPVWRDGAWEVVPDHRGETWWRADRGAVHIDRLGDPEAMGLLKARPPPPDNESVTPERSAGAASLPVYDTPAHLPQLTAADAGALALCLSGYGPGRRGLVFWDGDEWRRAKDGGLAR